MTASRRARQRRDKREPIPDFDEPEPRQVRGFLLEKKVSTEAITRQQLCASLSVSESTVWRWERDGLPYTMIGARSKRYDLAEIKIWLKGRECQYGSIKTDVGTLRSGARASAFTARLRGAQLRVMPSN